MNNKKRLFITLPLLVTLAMNSFVLRCIALSSQLEIIISQGKDLSQLQLLMVRISERFGPFQKVLQVTQIILAIAIIGMILYGMYLQNKRRQH